MSESLWNLKTIRDIKLPGDTFANRPFKTTNGLSGIEEQTPYTIDEKQVALQKENDRKWFARQDKTIAKARKKLLGIRSRLKGLKEQNKIRCRYRKQLQQQRIEREKKPIESSRNRKRAEKTAGSQIFLDY